MQAIVAGIAAIVFAGFTAKAGMANFRRPVTPAPAPAPAPAIASLDIAAPARGTTGSATLPTLPVAANAIAAGDGSIVPAAPFTLRGTLLDKSRALQCLTTAVYYEAANEPDDGQRAVAQVVLNRVRHPAFPATLCGVVFQGSDQRVCQFSFACDGAMARAPALAAWNRAQRVAASALYGSVFAPVGLATHYHTYAVTPSWNRSLVMTGVHGAHFFHRWKGYWGTPSAFTDRHTGHEPVPGPLRRIESEMPLSAATVAVAPPSVEASPGLSAYADSGTPIAPPAESQILDRWKDSGQPIR